MNKSGKDFFSRCEQLKKENKKHVNSIYNSFAYLRFAQTFELYRDCLNRYGEMSEQFNQKRTQLIAYSCFSNFKELNRHVDDEHKDHFNQLADFAQELAQQKTSKRIQIINFIGDLRRIAKFHKELLDLSENKQ